jgi:hypothetical protein
MFYLYLLMPGHLNGSSRAGALEETPWVDNMDRPAMNGHGQVGVNVVGSSAGSQAVGTGRDGPQRICGMRRTYNFEKPTEAVMARNIKDRPSLRTIMFVMFVKYLDIVTNSFFTLSRHF